MKFLYLTNKVLQNLKFAILLIVIFSSKSVIAQDRIDSAMTTLFEKYPEEKVYLAYDRTDYVIGETIWFKGFVFSGYTPSDISSNLLLNCTILIKKELPRK